MPTPEGRRTSEEELKQINSAYDCIKKHFASGHRQGPSCECQPTASNQQTGSGESQNNAQGNSGANGQAGKSQGSSNQGGFQREKTTYEKWAEQEACADAERRRHAEAHEAALKEALERARQAGEAQATTNAAKAKPPGTQSITEEQLRWKISIAFAAIFAFLLIGGFNKRYEPSSGAESEFSLSSDFGHLRGCPF